MDIALLPQIVDAVTEGYVEGLADGGWSGRAGSTDGGSAASAGSADGVRAAIRTCAVAKYCWLGAHILSNAAGAGTEASGQSNQYNQDDSVAEHLARIRPLAELLGHWADVAD
jgi:hypothetical protein